MHAQRAGLTTLRLLVLTLATGCYARLAAGGESAPQPASQCELVLQTGHAEGITSLALSPDGRLLASGSSDVIIWDMATGRKLRTLRGPARIGQSVAFNPQGTLVLTGSNDSTAAIWDVASGRCVRTLRDRKDTSDTYWFACFSPDGRRVLAGGWNKRAAVWDAASGELLWRFESPSDYVNAVAFSPDGRLAVVGTFEGKAYVLDADSGQQRHVLTGHADRVYSIAFSPDDGAIAVASTDHGTKHSGQLTVWDATDGRRLHAERVENGGLECVRYSPDGKQIVTGGFKGNRDGGEVISWEAATLRRIRTLALPNESDVQDFLFSSDGATLVTAGSRITTWDVAQERPLRQFGENLGARFAAISPDGRHIVAGSGGFWGLWDAATGQRVRALSAENGFGYHHWAAFDPQGQDILLWWLHEKPRGKELVRWHWREGTADRSNAFDTGIIESIAHSLDGRYVVTGEYALSGRSGDPGPVKLFDAITGQKIRTFQRHRGYADTVAIAPDGSRIFSNSSQYGSSKDNPSILWEAPTGQVLRELAEPSLVWSAAFSPDGKWACLGGYEQASILDTNTWRVVRTLSGHRNSVRCLTFSHDSRRLATAGSVPFGDDHIIIWDVASGNRLAKFQGHESKLNSLEFTPDGKYLLSAAWDGTVRLWDASTGNELLDLITFDANNWLVVTPSGHFDGSAGARQRVTYRVGGGLNVVPVDRFFQDFYRPGLLAEVFGGKRPTAQVVLGTSVAPTVRIVTPPTAGAAPSTNLVLEAEVTDRGGGIKGPWLVQNGARMLVPGAPQATGRTLRRTFPVALIEGENRIEVRAASADGSWESEPAVLTLKYERPLAKPKLYLVATGISRYAQSSMNLKFAAADAQAVAAVFQKRGPDLYGSDKVHVSLLLDEKATATAIKNALGQVAQQAKPQDTLVLFLAGHGTMLDQRYYLITHEFKLQAEKLEDDIRKQGLPGDELDDVVSAVPALKRVVIYDTCQSGGAIGVSRMRRNAFAFQKALEQMSRAQGSYILAASAASADAQEVPELGHGVLTYALLAGLGAVDTGPLKRRSVESSQSEPLVKVRQWFGFAQDEVPALTRAYFGQEQFVRYIGAGEDFPILSLAK